MTVAVLLRTRTCAAIKALKHTCLQSGCTTNSGATALQQHPAPYPNPSSTLFILYLQHVMSSTLSIVLRNMVHNEKAFHTKSLLFAWILFGHHPLFIQLGFSCPFRLFNTIVFFGGNFICLFWANKKESELVPSDNSCRAYDVRSGTVPPIHKTAACTHSRHPNATRHRRLFLRRLLFVVGCRGKRACLVVLHPPRRVWFLLVCGRPGSV